MNLIVLIGSGAVGKMTVGQELMKITNYRLFHNHHMIEPVIEIFGKFDGALVTKLREDVFDAFLRTDYTGMIFKAFTYGVGDAIVKGGRYDALLERFGKKAAAVGCVFLIDDIQIALSAQGALKEEADTVSWIVYDENGRVEALDEVKKLRNKGLRVSGIYFDKNKTKDDYIEYAKSADVSYLRFYGAME